ncbi:MAG: helix-turn-helix domain-containing protein [Acidobacteria bacterium]|nr:helix-turn-helix domain-containing protein [Acidobacteriota bacterium]
MGRDMLTSDDLAEYLHIHKNQIYRLIKEKRLPATRITGKWLFPKQLVDQWIQDSARKMVGLTPVETSNRVVIAGSNDIALESLTKYVHSWNRNFTVSLSNLGSAAGLQALGKGTCHIAAVHLLDVRSGEYNTPFVKKRLPGSGLRVVNLAHREQGFLLRRGNPLGIKTLQDIAKKKAVLINRQEGSGTRLLLDFKLKESQIDPSEISGYDTTVHTHMEVALAVMRGSADVGMGIRAAARLLNLDFVPVTTERFDLVIPAGLCSTEAISVLCKSLASEEFKSDVCRMGGYDIRETGRVLYEKA